MNQAFIRQSMLLGPESLDILSRSHVMIFGIGGVGSYCAEALARSGIGNIDIFDKDVVSLSNINRQIIALHSTVGRAKVDVMKERISDINPDCKVNAHCVFYLSDNAEEYDLSKYDYIVDAVDTVSAKAEIICRATRLGVPVISAMGAGNKIDPTKFKVADIYKTDGCPLARVMRRELKKRGIEKLKVVYSPESPQRAIDGEGEERVPGSLSFVPSVMGLIIAGEVIKDIIK